jgi:aspartyl-tRNA(Asn)/glutamyl-tRNA(Gln) amidotransferase subunit A
LLQTISQLGELFRNGSISPVELISDCLSQIEKLNPVLNAFITVMHDSALAQARQAEAEIRRGEWRGPLHGIPLGIKDLIDIQHVRTTAASELFKDRLATEDALIIRRLRNAGAVLLGKQNLHEFAYGGSSIVSYFGAVRNAWNPKFISGGSSGGSATAVAIGLGLGAIGTDTAGSIREPAGLCGVVGLKPTYGRISTQGVFPLSTSLDHVGPIARTVADAAAIFTVIANLDPRWVKGGVETANRQALFGNELKSLRIGIPHSFFFDHLNDEIGSAAHNALKILEDMGAELQEIDVTVPTDRTLQSAESYEIHSRYLPDSAELYQPETLRRIRGGQDFSREVVAKCLSELEHERRSISKIFEDLDLLATPTTPIPAPLLTELQQDPNVLRPKELLLLRNTRPMNVWGLPAISVPCGFTHAGLPIGLQIVGPHWGEAKVLQVAHAYEQASGWYQRSPALS